MRNTDAPYKGTCFISGAISSCLQSYRYAFSDAEQTLSFLGYETLAPTVFPTEGFTYDQYMNMNKALLLSCDTVCFLPNWKQSEGAKKEYGIARAMKKKIIYYEQINVEQFIAENNLDRGLE